MLAAIRQHKAVAIAIVLTLIIIAPAYYFLSPRSSYVAPLPVIKSTNATIEFNWVKYFSNSSFYGTYTLNYSFYGGLHTSGGLRSNITMKQPGFNESNIYIHFVEGASMSSPFELFSAFYVIGNLSLNPLPLNITIFYNNALPWGATNLWEFQGAFLYPPPENVSMDEKSSGTVAVIDFTNRSSLTGSQVYQFNFEWGNIVSLDKNIPLNSTYRLVFELVVNGLYTPVTSTFIINYINQKPG